MKFPASLPRRMYWSTEVGGCSLCPECRARLEPEYHTYLLFVRQQGNLHPFVVGGMGGHFCVKCPVVVLDMKALADLAALGMRGQRGGQFVVLGIVDLAAVPREKRHLPFDDEENPLPLVKFMSIGKNPASKKE